MEDKLQHHGIKGMRWGVRRTKAQLRRARGPDAPRRVTKEQYEAEKQKAIRSGDKATIERWKSHLSNTELQTAIDRVDKYQKLSNVGKENVKSGWEKTKGVMDAIGTTITFAKNLRDGYDVLRQVNNTFNSKFKMPELDLDPKTAAERRKAAANADTAEASARKTAADARKAGVDARKAEEEERWRNGKYHTEVVVRNPKDKRR